MKKTLILAVALSVMSWGLTGIVKSVNISYAQEEPAPKPTPKPAPKPEPKPETE